MRCTPFSPYLSFKLIRGFPAPCCTAENHMDNDILERSSCQHLHDVCSERKPGPCAQHAAHGAQVPGMDMVSYGPTIRGAHSPEERVEIATVAPFWEATLRLLGRLADRRA